MNLAQMISEVLLGGCQVQFKHKDEFSEKMLVTITQGEKRAEMEYSMHSAAADDHLRDAIKELYRTNF